MRILLQRVHRAEVRIRSEESTPYGVVGRIGTGFVLFVGFTHSDRESEIQWMVEKIAGLRLFGDSEGKLNLDLAAVNGSVLVVSQFTLYGDVSKGRRPSFVTAARPETAIPLYEQFILLLRNKGLHIETGTFGADMDVELVNDGPVTLWLERESREPVQSGSTSSN